MIYGGSLVSVDPGVDYYAWAQWDGFNHLVQVGRPTIETRICWPCSIAIEWPQVYKYSKARPKDVEALIFSAGRVADRAQGTIYKYRPAEWKGQQSKAAHHKKIRAALHPTELVLLNGLTKGELHDIMDAIGIGLYHLGRLT